MKYLLLIPILSVLFVTGIAYADGYAQRLDKPVGNYIANVDYDSPYPEIDPARPTLFSFQLWNKDRTETVPFTDAWVSISPKDSDVVFAGAFFRPDFGDTGFEYMFQKGGTYEAYVRFENKDKTLAEATFELPVTSSSTDPKQLAIVILACLLVGGAVYWLGRWRRKTLAA